MNVHPLHTGFGLSFLLEDLDGLYLVDSGSPGQEGVVMQKMLELGRNDLRLIWITHAHYDHYGSAAALRQLTGAKIGVHPLDAECMAAGISPLGTTHGRGFLLFSASRLLEKIRPLTPTPADFTLEDNNRLYSYGLNARILHTPGHTPGHSCLYLDDGIMFAGDLIARNPRSRLQDLLATDWNEMPASLAKVKAAHPQLVYTGHSTRPLTGEELQRIS